MPDLNPVAGHEFNAEERTNAHRLVATAMLVTFGTVFISQGWWTKIRDYVVTKTHGPTPPGGGGGIGNLTP